MDPNRRDFLAGTAGTAIAASGVTVSPLAAQAAEAQHAFEMPRGATLLNEGGDGRVRPGGDPA